MMMPTNGSLSEGPGGGRRMPTTIKPSIKKKPAPPRPPQPKINRIQTSMSFNTAQDLAPHAHGPRTATSGIPGKDLIDFSTPPGSPNSVRRNTVSNISTALKDPNEFSYRVGASIFYIKSPLKHSTSETPVQNPFSPPRPAAIQANLNAAWNSPAKHPQPPAAGSQISAWGNAPAPKTNSNNIYSGNNGSTKASISAVVNSQTQNKSSSPDNNNTIKSHYQNVTPSAWGPVGLHHHQSSSSTTSSDRNSSASFGDFGSNSQQSRYSNVPADALKKELSATLSSGSVGGGVKKPTIIRPASKVTATQSSSLSTVTAAGDTGAVASAAAAASARFSSRALMNSIKSESQDKPVEQNERSSPQQRNYYDVPPDEDDDDFDDETNDSSLMASPPMPSEPPPPPPADLAVDEWVDSTTRVTDYPDTYSDAGQVTAYAIALYDFVPEAQGDLQLLAGDLVYLIRKIDDSWFQGSCGGMEGVFPSNFVNVVVPLPEESFGSQNNAQSDDGLYADALYDFAPEAEGDLGLQAGDRIKVLGRINQDWLYGEKDGSKGQFPAAFVQEILQDLPIITL